MAYDTTQIISSIVNAPISPSSREIAAELVDAWIQENDEFDTQYETLAVESPWFCWIDYKTLLVGVLDRIACDQKTVFGCEHKTAKAPQKNRDGRDSAWWNESIWLQGISTGTQLAIYALALTKGTFVLPTRTWQPKLTNPRIMVRAAVKDNPVYFWPTNREDGIFEFPKNYLDKVDDALISKACQIRAAKKEELFPWALPGNHCTNRFRKLCPYYEKFCIQGQHPTSKPTTLFDESDPGSVAIAAAGVKPGDIEDTDLVIFSASSYDTAQQCPERYRILTGGYVEKESDPNLEIGTGMHTGLAIYYRQQIRKTNGKTAGNSVLGKSKQKRTTT